MNAFKRRIKNHFVLHHRKWLNDKTQAQSEASQAFSKHTYTTHTKLIAILLAWFYYIVQNISGNRCAFFFSSTHMRCTSLENCMTCHVFVICMGFCVWYAELLNLSTSCILYIRFVPYRLLEVFSWLVEVDNITKENRDNGKIIWSISYLEEGGHSQNFSTEMMSNMQPEGKKHKIIARFQIMKDDIQAILPIAKVCMRADAFKCQFSSLVLWFVNDIFISISTELGTNEYCCLDWSPSLSGNESVHCVAEWSSGWHNLANIVSFWGRKCHQGMNHYTVHVYYAVLWLVNIRMWHDLIRKSAPTHRYQRHVAQFMWMAPKPKAPRMLQSQWNMAQTQDWRVSLCGCLNIR